MLGCANSWHGQCLLPPRGQHCCFALLKDWSFWFKLSIYISFPWCVLLCSQDKSGGKVIYRNINILLLYRGRNYDTKNCPVIPLMLWKPYAPIYPRLVKNVIEGLTYEETKEMRKSGLNSDPLLKLSKWIIGE